jgi:hypothetical protein
MPFSLPPITDCPSPRLSTFQGIPQNIGEKDAPPRRSLIDHIDIFAKALVTAGSIDGREGIAFDVL